MNIYVGNLSYESNEHDVRQAFEKFGEVQNVSIITDKFSGKSRGFGFVEMSDASAGKQAIDGLSGVELNERSLVVNEARPRR